VNEDGSEISFQLAGPVGHIATANQSTADRMRCTSLAALLRRHGRWHINYLSLDIEGAELSALRDMDWSSTTIDVMTVENAKAPLVDFLGSNGMVPALCAHLDLVLVRKALLPAALRWNAQHGAHAVPKCVHNQTDWCIDSSRAFLECKHFWSDEARWQAASAAGGNAATDRGKGRGALAPPQQPGGPNGRVQPAPSRQLPKVGPKPGFNKPAG